MSNFNIGRPRPTDFENYLSWVCTEYKLDAGIIISRVIQKNFENVVATGSNEKLSRKLHLKARKVKEPFLVPSFSNSDTVTSLPLNKSVISNENKIMIETIYNTDDNLVALKFLKNKAIPRKVMEVIALTFPYQKHLTSITINSGLCVDSLYEISNFLPNSQITELCFDDAFVENANYHILLTKGKLKQISLARCTISDDIVKMITDQLKEPCPAARTLSALNLSNNNITDTGAKYIADMLRTNRQLCYLNLAGNMITDEGGVSILDTLQKFPLQAPEALEGRNGYVAHLKKKNDLINELVNELQTAAFYNNATQKKTIRKSKMPASQSVHSSKTVIEAQIRQDKAEYMANKKLGLYNEPFSPNNTEEQDGVVYCLGNNTLCCLNLAYNNLSYVSLKKLLEVLKMQKRLNRIPRGLIKVVVEGNLMPKTCEEFEAIDNLLEVKNSLRIKSASVPKSKHLLVKHRDK